MHQKTTVGWILLLALGLSFGCATRQQIARQNGALIQRYFDRWANHADTTVADQLMATNLLMHSPPAVLHSLAEYKQSMQGFHRAFPDLRVTIEDQIAQADKVAVRWNLRGTHSGEYQGRAATGKAVSITGTSTFRIERGKIQEIWVNLVRLALMQQLGWLPGPSNGK